MEKLCTLNEQTNRHNNKIQPKSNLGFSTVLFDCIASFAMKSWNFLEDYITINHERNSELQAFEHIALAKFCFGQHCCD
jgi:hypothetical protein